MKRRLPIVIMSMYCLCVHFASAQTNTFPSTGSAGIGTTSPGSSSLLEIKSTTKGLLIPRLTQTQRNAIASSVTGLLIYQTDNYPGFYYYDGSAWSIIGYWKRNGTSVFFNTGNVGFGTLVPNYKIDVKGGDINLSTGNYLRINGAKVFSDDAPNQNMFAGDNAGVANTGYNNTGVGPLSLNKNTNGNYNTAVGSNTLGVNTSGSSNVAVGEKSLYGNVTGTYNTALGSGALHNNVVGNNYVAVGYQSLYNSSEFGNATTTAVGFRSGYSNTSGNNNTMLGYQSMYYNTTGFNNTAVGNAAMQSSTTGAYNTAVGSTSLLSNTTGSSNTAVGEKAMQSNTTGGSNTALGSGALYSNNNNANTAIGFEALYNNSGAENVAVGNETLSQNTGNESSAIGFQSLYSNTSGAGNCTNGYQTMYFNTTGYFDVAEGIRALYQNTTGLANTAVGYDALYNNTTGSNITAIGAGADVNGDYSNATVLGAQAMATSSNQVILGNTSVTSVKATASFIIYSDGRFKKNINANVPGLAFIKQLKPVTYNYDIHGLNNHIGTSNKTNQPSTEAKQQNENAINAKEKIKYTGFVAQDVEAAAKKINYDFSGLYKPQNEHDAYGLSYADFVVPLVKAVQELSTQNDSLQQTNTSLQSQINELKAAVTMLANKEGIQISSSSASVSSASIAQNVPNPYNHSTAITYNLPSSFSSAQIIVTDYAGKVLKTVNISGTGKGVLHLDASALASGPYNYSLLINGKLIDTKKMILSK